MIPLLYPRGVLIVLVLTAQYCIVLVQVLVVYDMVEASIVCLLLKCLVIVSAPTPSRP